MIAPIGFCKLCYKKATGPKARYCQAHQPKSKHGNTKVADPVGGPVYDSKREAARGSELRMQEAAGMIQDLRRQVDFPLLVGGVKVCTFRADFVYTEPAAAGMRGGPWVMVVEDVKPRTRKGQKPYRTRLYKIKKRLVLALLGIEIREV
jgi:hypothetical protein